MASTAVYHLYAIPNAVAFGHNKTNINGLASEKETQDWVASEYGEPHRDWLLDLVRLADNHATVQQVLHAIQASNNVTLKSLMGNGREFEALDLVHLGQHPFSYVTPLNDIAHADALESCRIFCGPYKTVEMKLHLLYQRREHLQQPQSPILSLQWRRRTTSANKKSSSLVWLERMVLLWEAFAT